MFHCHFPLITSVKQSLNLTFSCSETRLFFGMKHLGISKLNNLFYFCILILIYKWYIFYSYALAYVLCWYHRFAAFVGFVSISILARKAWRIGIVQQREKDWRLVNRQTYMGLISCHFLRYVKSQHELYILYVLRGSMLIFVQKLTARTLCHGL